MAKNVLQNMNDILFEELERLSSDDLSGDELKAEISKSNAITNTAKVLVDNVRTSLEIVKYSEKRNQSIDNTCKLLGVTIDED